MTVPIIEAGEGHQACQSCVVLDSGVAQQGFNAPASRKVMSESNSPTHVLNIRELLVQVHCCESNANKSYYVPIIRYQTSQMSWWQLVPCRVETYLLGGC